MRLNDFFRESRRRMGLSQKCVAVKMGISTNYIWMVENGMRRPSLKLTLKLGELYGGSWGWLHEEWFNSLRLDYRRHRDESFEKLFRERVGANRDGGVPGGGEQA